MPTADQHEKRTYANQVKRHEAKLKELAEHIHENAGYLLAASQSERPVMAESYVSTIAADLSELQRRIAALDALSEISFVFADA